MSPLTAWLVQRMVKVKYMHLLNLILDPAVVPELRQQDVNAARLGAEVERLFSDPAAREAQVAQCRHALHRLVLCELSPSRRAPDQRLAMMGRHSRERRQALPQP